MKKILIKIIVSIVFLTLLSSCVMFLNKPEVIFPEHDKKDFIQQHASKNSKIYINNQSSYFENNHENESMKKENITVINDILKEIQFAKIESKKEDADYIMNIENNINQTTCMPLIIASLATLFVIPLVVHLNNKLTVTVTNKHGMSKKFYKEIDLNVWVDIVFLPVLPYFIYENHMIKKNAYNFFYTIGNDSIFLDNQPVS